MCSERTSINKKQVNLYTVESKKCKTCEMSML